MRNGDRGLTKAPCRSSHLSLRSHVRRVKRASYYVLRHCQRAASLDKLFNAGVVFEICCQPFCVGVSPRVSPQNVFYLNSQSADFYLPSENMLADRRADVFQHHLPLRTLSYAHVVVDAPYGFSILAASFLASGLVAYIQGLNGKEQGTLSRIACWLMIGLACSFGQILYHKGIGGTRVRLENTICGHMGRNSRMTPRQLHAMAMLQLRREVSTSEV